MFELHQHLILLIYIWWKDIIIQHLIPITIYLHLKIGENLHDHHHSGTGAWMFVPKQLAAFFFFENHS